MTIRGKRQAEALRLQAPGPAPIPHCNRLSHGCRAGLDVFEDEPEAKPGLLDCDNVVTVPHIASASVWTRAGMVSERQQEGVCYAVRQDGVCVCSAIESQLPMVPC